MHAPSDDLFTALVFGTGGYTAIPGCSLVTRGENVLSVSSESAALNRKLRETLSCKRGLGESHQVHTKMCRQIDAWRSEKRWALDTPRNEKVVVEEETNDGQIVVHTVTCSYQSLTFKSRRVSTRRLSHERYSSYLVFVALFSMGTSLPRNLNTRCQELGTRVLSISRTSSYPQ